MNRLFAFFSCAALAGSLLWTAAPVSAQTKSLTAPVRGFSNPLGSNSALAGQSRPLGGVAGPSYSSGHRSGRYGHGYGVGGYGFATYVPGYWDALGDPVGGGPYSYTWPAYGALAPPPPPSAGVPGVPGGAPPPPVIINNYYGYPPPPGAGAEYGPPQAEGAARPGDPLSEPQNYYLIVYKDHSIHAALAYWVEGGTLHYVTTDNAHNQVSLDLVDVDASTKLNSDHNVPFSIAGR